MDSSNANVPIEKIPLFIVWQAADHIFGMQPWEAAKLTSEEQHDLIRTRAFDVFWHLELGLNRKNSERTVWSATKQGNASLCVDNPGIDGLRLQFKRAGIKDEHDPSFDSERNHLHGAITELGRISNVVDDLSAAAESVMRDTLQLRDDYYESKSAIDTITHTLSNIASVVN